MPVLVAAGVLLAVTIAALFEARSTSTGVRELRTAIQERDGMQGAQSIKHTVSTPAGPADVTTTRGHGESIDGWLERHSEALSAVMGG